MQIINNHLRGRTYRLITCCFFFLHCGRRLASRSFWFKNLDLVQAGFNAYTKTLGFIGIPCKFMAAPRGIENDHVMLAAIARDTLQDNPRGSIFVHGDYDFVLALASNAKLIAPERRAQTLLRLTRGLNSGIMVFTMNEGIGFVREAHGAAAKNHATLVGGKETLQARLAKVGCVSS